MSVCLRLDVRLSDNLPSGLFSFASTTFILSMYNVSARGITVPNAVIGMACFVGGLAQFAAGMWGTSSMSFGFSGLVD